MKFTTASPSLEKAWEGNSTYGRWVRSVFKRQPLVNNIAPTGTAGIFGARIPVDNIIPSISSPVHGMTLGAKPLRFNLGSLLAGLEYKLGSIDMTTGVFTKGVDMPVKKVAGEDIQTAAGIVFMHIKNTVVTSIARTFTVTYTNQAGTTNQTFDVEYPATALLQSSIAFLNPIFATNTSGVFNVTNITVSAGLTGGEVEVLGVLPVSYVYSMNNAVPYALDFLTSPMPAYKGVAGEAVGFYTFGLQNASDFCGMLIGIPEA